MTSEEQALAEAIEGLYKTFSHYALAQKIEGCPCCVSEEDESSLHRKPLRELTTDDLILYAFKALTTWGTEDDFKHFLPRLFELASEQDSLAYEMAIEVIFSKLRYAKWNAWPEPECAAVRRYLLALWQFALSVPTEAVTIDEYLCAIGQAEDDLSLFLDIWQNLETDTAIMHLVKFADSPALASRLHKRKLGNAFWQERREQMLQVVEWLSHIGLA